MEALREKPQSVRQQKVKDAPTVIRRRVRPTHPQQQLQTQPAPTTTFAKSYSLSKSARPTNFVLQANLPLIHATSIILSSFITELSFLLLLRLSFQSLFARLSARFSHQRDHRTLYAVQKL
jgi:hypothetical protein